MSSLENGATMRKVSLDLSSLSSESPPVLLSFSKGEKPEERIPVQAIPELLSSIQNRRVDAPRLTLSFNISPELSPSQELKEHMSLLDSEFQDATNQLELKQRARENLVQELNRIDASIANLTKRRDAIGFERSCVHAALASTRGEETEARMRDLTDDAVSFDKCVASFLWFVQPTRLRTLSDSQLLNVLTAFFSLLASERGDVEDASLPWGEVCAKLVPLLQEARPDFQHVILSILAELGRSEANQQYLFDAGVFNVVVRLLRSINNQVIVEALNCITILATAVPHKDAVREAGGLQTVIGLLAHPSELVQEKAAAAMWSLVISDANKAAARDMQGIEALIRLLGSENEAVLDNVAIALGYMTRNDTNKEMLRDSGGLQALINLLDHPSASIQTKAAGALWNCASNAQNKIAIREMNGLAALIRLLGSHNESVQENAAGALWNCAVDASNKAAIRELDGLSPLIRLLTSENEAVLENASGALWNCAAIGESRSMIRKLNGLQPLLGLLRHPSEAVQENAAGAVRNCAINDPNKVAIRTLGGLPVLIDLLSTPKASILEKVVSTLWICSINPENKIAIREADGLQKLIDLLRSPLATTPIVEKTLGTLRNCSTLAENKAVFRDAGGLEALVTLLQDRAASPTIHEYAAATMWNCARCDENKPYLRNAGAIEVLLYLLRTEASSPDAVHEHAAGALLSLSVNGENKDHIRNAGGLQILYQLLQVTKSEYVKENILGALKNCAANHANSNLLRELDVAPYISTLLSEPQDAVVKEACLLLKNMAVLDANKLYIAQSGAIEPLLNLYTHANQSKAAAQTLQILAKNGESRRLIEQMSRQRASAPPQQPTEGSASHDYAPTGAHQTTSMPRHAGEDARGSLHAPTPAGVPPRSRV
eukprot:gnl/Trimastix_PCT/4269.p1 GENE.gnl/Trimastix_PCT/4269~~gnl/Trimastix_PCT/4269.p1  ORF type:complete len:891 (+),score=295.30 gnl/Trimastix_PCT/4269:45-2717(+)